MGFISNPSGIPVIVTACDANENCLSLSLYNINDDAISYDDELCIFHPVLKQVKLEREGEVSDHSNYC
jgi:hypothetical protein